MSKNKALSEDKKLQIAELYDNGELSIGAIAENLGVSVRTVHNYKNYRETTRSDTIQGEENNESLTEEEETDLQIYEMIHSRYTDSEIAQEVGISEDTVRNYRGNQKNAYEKNSEDIYEEPKQINFVGGKKHIESEEGFKEEELEEFDYECHACGHEFNGELSQCPKCETEFDLESYEYNYECSECGHKFNGDLKRCPSCGDKFD